MERPVGHLIGLFSCVAYVRFLDSIRLSSSGIPTQMTKPAENKGTEMPCDCSKSLNAVPGTPFLHEGVRNARHTVHRGVALVAIQDQSSICDPVLAEQSSRRGIRLALFRLSVVYWVSAIEAALAVPAIHDRQLRESQQLVVILAYIGKNMVQLKFSSNSIVVPSKLSLSR